MFDRAALKLRPAIVGGAWLAALFVCPPVMAQQPLRKQRAHGKVHDSQPQQDDGKPPARRLLADHGWLSKAPSSATVGSSRTMTWVACAGCTAGWR